MNSRTYTHNEKVTVLYGYLVEGGSMVDVAKRYGLPNETGFGISVVTQAYGFSGRNSGLFGSTGKFFRQHGFIPTRDHIALYVQTYPNGVDGDGYRILEGFLLTNNNSYSTNVFPEALEDNDYNSDEEIVGEIIGGVGGCILIIVIMFFLWKLFF